MLARPPARWRHPPRRGALRHPDALSLRPDAQLRRDARAVYFEPTRCPSQSPLAVRRSPSIPARARLGERLGARARVRPLHALSCAGPPPPPPPSPWTPRRCDAVTQGPGQLQVHKVGHWFTVMKNSASTMEWPSGAPLALRCAARGLPGHSLAGPPSPALRRRHDA